MDIIAEDGVVIPSSHSAGSQRSWSVGCRTPITTGASEAILAVGCSTCSVAEAASSSRRLNRGSFAFAKRATARRRAARQR